MNLDFFFTFRNKWGNRAISLRGRRSKGKEKGIRARDHALARAPIFPLPTCRRLLFPLLHTFPRATKEIGDVCTQANIPPSTSPFNACHASYRAMGNETFYCDGLVKKKQQWLVASLTSNGWFCPLYFFILRFKYMRCISPHLHFSRVYYESL